MGGLARNRDNKGIAWVNGHGLGFTPTRRSRLIVALLIGALAGAIALAYQLLAAVPPDFIYPWTAARLLAHGQNPYASLPGGLAAPFEAPLLYPLPAAMVALLVSWLPLPLAVGCFVGLSLFLLAYAATEERWDTLLFFASAPMLMAVILGQWSPLLVAGALLPVGGFVAVAKPNIGLALSIYRPTRFGILGSCALLIASIVLLPSWPGDWIRSLALDHQSGTHLAPIARPAGFILVLSLLRWRRPEARLLLAMACIPQLLFFYDQVPLMLVPKSQVERYVLVFSSGTAFLMWMVVGHGSERAPAIAAWCVMLGIYFPCLAMILRRPNEGSIPAWVERGVERVRAVLGSAVHRAR